MMASRERCNHCGVPESEWGADGVCRKCSGKCCEMTEDQIIDARVYAYAAKNDMLFRGCFEPLEVRTIFEKIGRKKKVPQYFRDAIAADGMTFSSLDQFPVETFLRVCRDSNDGTFMVGDVVWRSKPQPGRMDGINFVQKSGCLDKELCQESLRGGAMFEETYGVIPT